MSKTAKIVLLDADVISHFIVCSELLYLHKILAPHSLRILDQVYLEIARIPSRKLVLDNLLASVREVQRIQFPTADLNVKKEFALIKRNNPLIGDSERAYMAVAKFNKDIIASSNFRDIAPYCTQNNINFIGTLDILSIALTKGIFDDNRCNRFIKAAIMINKARFPFGVQIISDYTIPDLGFIY